MKHPIDRKVSIPAVAALAPNLHRRAVLAGGGALLLQLVVPLSGCGGSEPVPGSRPGGDEVPGAGFLCDAHLRALRAFTDRMIPADSDPGALAADAANAIDRLLGAFQGEPAFIYAGAPFSDRAGHAQNDFLKFVPLDEYEALGWRIEIEGSQGLPEREFNGPVKGLQAIYREGLARLDELAAQQGFADFASAPAPVQEMILGGDDAAVAELIDVGFPDTIDATYGAPEYGGNRELVGWGFTAYDGDVQPRGYTDDEVVNPDNPGPLDVLLPPSFHDPSSRAPQSRSARSHPTALPAPTGASPALTRAPPMESMFALIQAANGRLSMLRTLLAPAAGAGPEKAHA